MLTIGGRRFRLQPVQGSMQGDEQNAGRDAQLHSAVATHLQTPPPLPAALPEDDAAQPMSNSSSPPKSPADLTDSESAAWQQPLLLDLQSALQMVGGQHPAVGFAQWRVQEAYAVLERAETLWLPSLQAGFHFNRHDGNLQASDGRIMDVNRSSFQGGLGAGAVGAGMERRPGVVAEFHVADAIFEPRRAEKVSWAAGHDASAALNDQLLEVAVAYLQLLGAEQEVGIVEQTRSRTGELATLTRDFAETGRGLQADADRLTTALALADSRWIAAQERRDVAAARLAQALSVNADQAIRPSDPALVPIHLVPDTYDKGTLITTGLTNRPELKGAQCLVAAACDEYQRQRYAPFVPSVLLGLSQSGFGGGVGSTLDDIDSKTQFDALVTWEIRNLGLGERAERNRTHARIEQARYAQLRLLDQVAREVSEAHAQVARRAQRIEVAEKAIQAARDSYDRNLRRIRDGQGLPLEVLQSIDALDAAQRAYLEAVVDYNEAQFRLQWSLGWPVSSGV